jgi:hypothetical protein
MKTIETVNAYYKHLRTGEDVFVEKIEHLSTGESVALSPIGGSKYVHRAIMLNMLQPFTEGVPE